MLNKTKISYLILSFNIGLSYISELSINYLFKNNFNIEPETFTYIMSISKIPWLIKPIFGIISDFFPIFGYRRKMYIILLGIINLFSYLLMSLCSNNLMFSFLLLFITNCVGSFSSVLGQAIIVELNFNKDEDMNNLMTMENFVGNFGYLIASYLEGILNEKLNIENVFLISAGISIFFFISGGFLNEKKINSKVNDNYLKLKDKNNENNNNNININDNEHNIFLEEFQKINEKNYNNKNNKKNIEKKEIHNNYTSLLLYIKQKKIIIALLIILLVQSFPLYTDSFFYYCDDILNFSPAQFGYINIFGTLLSLFFIYLYNYFEIDNKKTKFILIILSILRTLIKLFHFFIYKLTFSMNKFYLVFVINSLDYAIEQTILMPICNLSGNLSPSNLEGSVFSIFMSINNFGGILGGIIGVWYANFLGIKKNNFENLGKLILMCNFSVIVPIFILFIIPEKYFDSNFYEKEKNKLNIKNNIENINNNNNNNNKIKKDEIKNKVVIYFLNKQ